MKTLQKFSIVLLAVLLTFVGFKLIASPDMVQMIKIGNEAGFCRISNHLAMKEKASDAQDWIQFSNSDQVCC